MGWPTTPLPIPPIPPLVINPGLVAVINNAMSVIQTYLDQLTVGVCPKNSPIP